MASVTCANVLRFGATKNVAMIRPSIHKTHKYAMSQPSLRTPMRKTCPRRVDMIQCATTTRGRGRSCAAASNSEGNDNSFTSPKKGNMVINVLGLGAVVASAAYIMTKHSMALTSSGFFASLSLIFASEIGDKTFFIAGLLAMRYGRLLSFLGSVCSLGLMTVISVIIGYAVQRVPTVVESSEVIGKYLSAASLLYFGLKSLKSAWSSDDSDAGDEFSEAEEQVASAEESGSIQGKASSTWKAFMEIAGLIFVAEWGDRSMLATIALGAAQSPIGVAGGAILGHTIATFIAVLGGAALADKISEKTVNIIGGSLFIIFAIATTMGVF